MPHGFDRFWDRYPRKVGKLVAMKAFDKALRRATEDEIMAGVELYRIHMPCDVQFVAHPASWLNAGRWMDEYASHVPDQKVYWAEECRAMHGGGCIKQWEHEMRKREVS